MIQCMSIDEQECLSCVGREIFDVVQKGAVMLTLQIAWKSSWLLTWCKMHVALCESVKTSVSRTAQALADPYHRRSGRGA
jgi:hypothetical protein